jgi:hypothetical protein
MRYLFILLLMAFGFSSCLKQSIADAMLEEKNGPAGPTASLSYKANGTLVSFTVQNADQQNYNNFTLACLKTNYYSLQAAENLSEFTFNFFTDSLTKSHYLYPGSYGNMFFISNNNRNLFVHVPTDSMSFNVTSYDKGHISGNFTGVLTPLESSGIVDVYGAPGSVHITEGSFKNVPVFY